MFYFGGVPQELLFDQVKAVITRDLRLEGGALVRSAEFVRFAHHLGLHAPRVRRDRGQGRPAAKLSVTMHISR